MKHQVWSKIFFISFPFWGMQVFYSLESFVASHLHEELWEKGKGTVVCDV